MKNKFAAQVVGIEEGYDERPYYDILRYPTIGIGKKIGSKNAPLPNFTMPFKVAYFWLEYDLSDIENQIADLTAGHNEVRSAVLISMAYQIGVAGLREFTNFLTAMEKNHWAGAKHHMLDSLWASEKQTPERALRHAEMILTGESIEYYNHFNF